MSSEHFIRLRRHSFDKQVTYDGIHPAGVESNLSDTQKAPIAKLVHEKLHRVWFKPVEHPLKDQTTTRRIEGRSDPHSLKAANTLEAVVYFKQSQAFVTLAKSHRKLENK